MERQDFIYFALALVVIALIGLVVKPMLPNIAIHPIQREGGSPTPNTSVEYTPVTGTPEVRSTPMTIATVPTATGSVEEMPGALGNTVQLDYPVLSDMRPHPPEEPIRSSAQNSSAGSLSQSDATPVLSRSYSMRYLSVGYLIEAQKTPVVIDLEITPKSKTTNPYYTFFVATVRDPLTMEVIEENGYGRQYSLRKDKQIVLYKSGRYHLTLYGNDVDVTIRIFIGNASVIKPY